MLYESYMLEQLARSKRYERLQEAKRETRWLRARQFMRSLALQKSAGR